MAHLLQCARGLIQGDRATQGLQGVPSTAQAFKGQAATRRRISFNLTCSRRWRPREASRRWIFRIRENRLQRQCRDGVRATQEIAWLCVAFGMDVAAFSPSLDADEAYESGVLFADSPQSLFARSTHVVLSCPLNEGTRNLVDRNLIELMPSEECGRHLVNVARGGVAVEADIAACLAEA